MVLKSRNILINVFNASIIQSSKIYVAVEKLEENPTPASTATARSQKLF